ncbi:MAG: ketoacyl-ACP synthase III [Lentisphaerae bacterium]|nr:ketoacyl-ACP synthase III [Lentisphaerota bacterium]
MSEQRVKISGVGGYLPARRVSNDELAQTLDTSDEWIVSHTGIRARHIMAADESGTDMAEQAARAALARAGVSPADLGLIVVATTTADYGGFPSNACLLQARLGAPAAAAFDLGAACTGFVYALEVARGLMLCGSGRPALVVGAEAMSRLVDWTDRNTCVLFGDGAGAAVLEVTTEPDRGILGSYLRADGTGSGFLWAGGGLRVPPPNPEPRQAHMQGRPVFNFAVKAMAEVVLHFLETLQIAPEEVRYVVPHQANIRILQAAQKRLPIAPDRFVVTIDEVANTSAASIPLALAELDRQGRLAPGDVVLTTGFGAGLTYGGNAIRW